MPRERERQSEVHGCRHAAPERCSECPVRQSGICSALSEKGLCQLSRFAFKRTYRPGEIILRSDDPPVFRAGIRSGIVKLTKLLADGRQQIVDFLFPADFVGRPFSRSTPYFAEAAIETELCCFRVAEFEALVVDEPGMKQYLLESALDKLDAAHDWMVLLGRKTAEERVASLLHHLVTRARLPQRVEGDTNVVPTLELQLKREEMASFLGLTYETVIRQIKALDAQGVITLNGRREFSVPDVDLLRRASG